jgi:hypothetical protein
MYERSDLARLHGMQAAQLQYDEEQEENHRAPGAEQVLPILPEARRAQGAEVDLVKG